MKTSKQQPRHAKAAPLNRRRPANAARSKSAASHETLKQKIEQHAPKTEILDTQKPLPPDPVDEASDESFPASDPPAFTGMGGRNPDEGSKRE